LAQGPEENRGLAGTATGLVSGRVAGVIVVDMSV
jgi:hypothetical protein